MANISGKKKRRTRTCEVCGSSYKFDAAVAAPSVPLPCPVCGCVSPAAASQRRGRWHYAIATAAAALALILIAAALFGMSISTWCLIAGLVGTVLVPAHVAVAVWDPNRDLERNRARMRELISSNKLAVVNASSNGPAQPISTHGVTPRQVALICTSAVAVCLMVSAELVRRHKGWIANENFGVVGPGDTLSFEFPNELRSLSGIWSGGVIPEFVLTDTRKARLTGLTGSTHTDEWGDEIQSSGHDKVFTPWATVTLPEHDELSWRQVELSVLLNVRYPAKVRETVPGAVFNRTAFSDRQQSFGDRYHLILSDPHAGQSHRRLWMFGGFGGLLLLVASGLGLSINKPE